jgi:hypothetical protein
MKNNVFSWATTLVYKMPLNGYTPLVTVPDWEGIDQMVERQLKEKDSFPDVEQYLKSIK